MNEFYKQRNKNNERPVSVNYLKNNLAKYIMDTFNLNSELYNDEEIETLFNLKRAA